MCRTSPWPTATATPVGILLGNGDGSFASALTFSHSGYTPTGLAVADFNGDTVPDIAVSNYSSNNVGVLIGVGDGTFWNTLAPASGGSHPQAVAAGDFNGDGRQDLAVVNYDTFTHTVGVLLGNGNGTFAGSVTYDTGGTSPLALTTGDFDDNGLDDIAVANYYDGTVGVLMSSGGGTFAGVTTFASGGAGPRAVAAGDIDGDAVDDVVVGNFGGTSDTVGVMLSDGAGSFAPVATFATGGAALNNGGVALGDLNSDGTMDIAVTNFDDGTVGLLANNGDGTFADAAASGAGGAGPVALAIGDLNGDAMLDIVVANRDSDTVGILLNGGVVASNTAPVADAQSVATYVDEPVDIALTGSDAETPAADLVFTVTSLPASGVLMQGETVLQAGDILTGTTVTYAPGIESDATSVSFTFTVTDTGDGGSDVLESDPATVTIAIEQYAGVGISDGVLTFGGGAGIDTVTSEGGVLIINGTPVSTDGVTEIRIWTGDGNDDIDLSGLSIPTMVYAGAGDDTIVGGSGDDIVLGGAGSDTVTGADGNDLLIGGDDADRVVGSAGNDILISGNVGIDATLADLRGLLAFWADQVVTSEETDATDEIVEGDDSRDVLTGSSGADWFIISVGDRITDMSGKLKKLISAGVGGEYGDNYVTFV